MIDSDRTRPSFANPSPRESPACRILVVEDNPATLKMLRFVLEADGYIVIPAPDARTARDAAAADMPDLVLQDLILPDMDGFELVRHLRALPGGGEMPILALSGFLGRLEEARTTEAGFTALLVKPILPSQLLESIRPYLRRQPDLRVLIGEGRRLLIVDDNAVQLKLDRVHFSQLGFEVTTAVCAADALAGMSTEPLPDVILCDVIMEDVDGFQFCLDVRAHPTWKSIPIVLVSAHHGTDSDRDLAARVGASAFLLRTHGFEHAAAALLEALKSAGHAAGSGAVVSDQVRLQHASQVIKRLERQLELTSSIARQSSHQAGQLALLSGVSALMLNDDLDVALTDVLMATFDAAGISKGALFLRDGHNVLRVRQAIGFTADNCARLEECLSSIVILDEMINRGSVVSVPSATLAPELSELLLSGGGVSSAQIVPLVTDGHGVGAIVIAAIRADMAAEDAIPFARAMGNQLVQSLELAKSVARLTASEARYRTLFESASDTIAIVTTAGEIREVNRRWEEILGRPRAALVGCRLADFVAPTKLPSNGGELPEPAAAGGMYPLAIAGVNGSTVLMEFTDTPVQIDGESVRFVVGRDVTERRVLEERLRQAQKLEAIGRVAGGAAHDFNNVLTAILGFCHILLEDLSDNPSARRDLLEIQKAGQRATALTKQLLAFSRQQVLQPKVYELNALVGGIEPMLRRLILENTELIVTLDPDAGLITIDLTQFEQILINLVVNARDAMPRGGKLSIGTAGARLEGREYVALTVTDTGTGMDEATQRHIFEPFFTTKSLGKGTGLGLSTVYGIVTQSGGNITLASEPARGSTFTIHLPRSTAAGAAVKRADPAAEIPVGWETVLVVEDDPAVRRLAALALGRSGYHVLEAGSPREADQVALEYPEPIHLMVSDVVMPESEGAPLFQRLQLTRPALRVLYMSGYPDDTIARHGIVLADVPFLQKPFTRPALARKVREVLDA